jgi:hypothetical protein
MPIPRIDLPQGTLDPLILRTVSLGPQHGWAISERVQQVSGEVLRIQQGSLYPPFTGFTLNRRDPNRAPGRRIRRGGSRFKMNSLRSALTAAAACQTITRYPGKGKHQIMNLPNLNNS